MSKSKIPMRPSGKYNLSGPYQDALSWYFLSGESQTEVYRKFIRPDLQTSKAALDKLAKAFFADKEVRKYLSDYEETINALFEPKEKPKPAKTLTEEEMKERIMKGIDKLKEFAFNQAEVIDTLEEPGEVIKLWKSLGLFGDEEEVVEAPRRYLPTMCSECRYKAFCEQECEDLCEICKYKKYANENGVHYETKEQLINPNKE